MRNENLLDINDLGRRLKIPIKTIRNKMSDGSWPLAPLRIGRALRWRESDVDRIVRGEVLIPSATGRHDEAEAPGRTPGTPGSDS